MSIYQGYRFPKSVDMLKMLADINSRMEPLVDGLALRAIGAASVMIKEGNSLNDVVMSLSGDQVRSSAIKIIDPENTVHVAAAMLDGIQHRIGSPNPGVVPELFDLFLQVVFVADPEEKDWNYAVLYCQRGAIIEEWNLTPQMEDFSYWSQSEKPEHVTDEEWQYRRESWNRVLANSTSFAQIGMTWNFRHQYSYGAKALSSAAINPDLVLQACSSWEPVLAETFSQLVMV